MPLTLIEQKPDFKKKVEGEDKLAIAEFFADTLQGEGVSAGQTATFLRLQGCTLKCIWCDTLDVWSTGNEYGFDEIFDLLVNNGIIDKFRNGQRLILTGGSPLKQQDRLVRFLSAFEETFNFLPFIEVENESVLMPSVELVQFIHQWNNSPKLANSNMKMIARYKPLVLSYMSSLPNSWFKFVVKSEEDWNEIKEDFLDTELIARNQIILMPEGMTQEELQLTRELTADIAIREEVRFSDRLHVTIWNKKTGV